MSIFKIGVQIGVLALGVVVFYFLQTGRYNMNGRVLDAAEQRVLNDSDQPDLIMFDKSSEKILSDSGSGEHATFGRVWQVSGEMIIETPTGKDRVPFGVTVRAGDDDRLWMTRR